MKLSRITLAILTGLTGLVLVLSPPAAYAETEQTILAFEGKPIRVVQAAYGDLDPLGNLADPRSSVLALQIPRAGGSQLELVPGTEGPEVERSFSLLFDRESESLFVFWESLGGRSTDLNLAGRTADGAWTEVVEISGSPLSPKTSPKLAITRDEFTLESGEGMAVHGRRSTLHLVWSEDRRDRHQTLVYSPVVLANGKYLGPNAVYELEDLAGGEPAADAPAPTPQLLESILVTTGTDGHSVVLAFANSKTHRLVTLHIEALSTELVAVADAGRASIDVFGNRETVRRVLDVARPSIDVFGGRIHPGVRSFMAQSIERGLTAAADADGRLDPRVAASIVWEEIIRAGASVEDQGLLDEETLQQPQILEVIARRPEEEREDGTPLLQMRVASNRPVPTIGESLQTRLFVSADGRDVIASWLDGKRLLYVESQADGWSAVQGFDLGEHLSLGAAYDLLERRVR